MQVSEKERQSQLESAFRDIANIIADKCVNPETKRPYPVSMIEKCLKQIHFSVKPNRSTKQQALEVIPKLKDVIPIDRAQMKLKVITHKKNRQQIKQLAKEVETNTVHQDGQLEMVLF